MAGVKKFDQNEVLDRATALFWQRGYEATSVEDLVRATGINRGSMYATFGNKKRLFLAVLDRYQEKVVKPLIAELADSNPHRAVERMFEAIIRRTSDPNWPRGCLYTNTSLECPGSGDEISRKIAEGLGQQESVVYQVLRRAQSEGSLDQAQDARALARFFVSVAHGLNVVNKAAPDPAFLRDVVKIAMRVWAPSSQRMRDHSAAGLLKQSRSRRANPR